MKVPIMTLATICMLSIGAATLSAQEEAGNSAARLRQPPPAARQRRERPGPPIMSFDRNRDGKVSRDEAPAKLRERFDRIDTNGDGLIDADEADRHAERLGRRRPGGDRTGTRPTRTGLLHHEQGVSDGYTLFAPLRSTTTYLIDMKGNIVHTWESDAPPGHAVYLLDNGNLLRCAREPGDHAFGGGGLGGRIREIEWDGTVVWNYVYANDRHMQHHDIEPLPNGNVLLIAWEKKSEIEAIAAGRDPALIAHGEVWPDHVVEVKPKRPSGGTIVWEWHVWDHLIQDFDSMQADFGVVADHPELIDVNFEQAAMRPSPPELRRLQGLGYVGSSPPPNAREGHPDWTHTNSVAYNAELDQIALSVHSFSEVWIIDHSTTTEEAAGHTGGCSGKGGDLLYRWGNPQTYQTGDAVDQQFFAQHDVQWIARGSNGAGNLLAFNNGPGRPGGQYSSVDEITPPLGRRGRYKRKQGSAFGPAKPRWTYTAAEKSSFYSGHISGAQRLPNGNTLICSGEHGRFFEIDRQRKIVWEYVNPFGGEVPVPPPVRLSGPPEGRRRGPPPGQHGQRRARGDQRHGPGGPGGGNPNAVFRAIRLSPDHPGLAGKNLKPSAHRPSP